MSTHHWPKPPDGITILKHGTPGYAELSCRFRSARCDAHVLNDFIADVLRQFKPDQLAILAGPDDAWRVVARKGVLAKVDAGREAVRNAAGHRAITKSGVKRDQRGRKRRVGV